MLSQYITNIPRSVFLSVCQLCNLVIESNGHVMLRKTLPSIVDSISVRRDWCVGGYRDVCVNGCLEKRKNNSFVKRKADIG